MQDDRLVISYLPNEACNGLSNSFIVAVDYEDILGIGSGTTPSACIVALGLRKEGQPALDGLQAPNSFSDIVDKLAVLLGYRRLSAEG